MNHMNAHIDSAKLETDHEQLVRALIKSPEDLRNEVTLFKLALIHSALGIAGELGELEDAIAAVDYDGAAEAHENLLEEAGDMFFYIRDIRHQANLRAFPYSGYTVPAKPISYFVGEAVDTIKKCAIYNQEFDEAKASRLLTALNHLEGAVVLELDRTGHSREEALQHNLTKLNKRYEGMKYSDAAAKARADKDDDLDDPLPHRQCGDGEVCESCQ